ncbi:hypothetical protein ACJDU8_10655 [Clostridium sp. WILCCON 0269]|uniref:DUF3953 domain-containing protein n=1 Tax=Candidatus Clostridium eludens TaxID=3381663 RepID=A0ABW8SL13_9CLOT
MKSKYSIVRFIFGILTIVLSISALISYTHRKVIMPYVLTSLGVFQIFNGIHFYRKNKKSEGILTILSSAFIFVVVIIIVMFL